MQVRGVVRDSQVLGRGVIRDGQCKVGMYLRMVIAGKWKGCSQRQPRQERGVVGGWSVMEPVP